jgi:hypothetical protein
MSRWPLIALALASWPAWGLAHDLGVEARLKDGHVHLEAYYDDDTAASEAKVRVTDTDNHLVTSGRTDEKGKWVFPAPQPGRYLVTVDAGGGHRVTIRLTIPQGAKPPDGKEAGTVSQEQQSAAEVVSEGRTREEFTRFPWARLLMGLAAIALLAGFARWWLAMQQPTPNDSTAA